MKKIIILSGEPESINSEIIFKVWKKISNQLRKKIYIVGSFNLLNKQLVKLGYKINLEKVNKIEENINTNKLKIIDVKLSFNNPFKINKHKTKNYLHQSFNIAHKIATKNLDIAGIINCSVDKKFLDNKKLGVTEYLASKCLIKKNSEVMLIRNNKLAVSPITTHNNLREIPKKLSKKLIITKVKSINYYYKKIFSKKPKIAVLGLNPHNGELKKYSEEIRIIIPAIKHLKKLNVNIYGPYVSDTIFINDYKKFDVIVGMYHDQVLAPFKALYKFNAINLTLGLDYLRASPDHGVAGDLIGKNKANHTSLLECIKFINQFG